MSSCEILSLEASAKACSGKCKTPCRSAPRVWVVAACEGMISLFEKTLQGSLSAILSEGRAVFASADQFQHSIEEAEQRKGFDQLVIIGSRNDIAWIHASLPAPATLHIAAEIEYPLLPAWFKQPAPLHHLAHALDKVFGGV